MLERFSHRTDIKIIWQVGFLLFSSSGAIILYSIIALAVRGQDSADLTNPLLQSEPPSPTAALQQIISPSLTPFLISTLSPLPTVTDTPFPAALPTSITECLPTDTITERGLVVNVVDGDTIEVNVDGLEYRVAYLGIEAPGLDEFGGFEAFTMNLDLVSGKTVTLIKEPGNTDDYNQLLRYVIVDELFVNYELLVRGFAAVTSFQSDYNCVQSFMTAQWIAMQECSGLWGIKPTPVAQEQLTEQPDLTVPYEIVAFSSPVKVGSIASLSIQVTADKNCNLSYITPSGNTSTAKGLGITTADGNGLCSWKWTIGSGTKPGTGTLNITVDGVTQSLNIEVVK
jgi:endonuclease YncB( thermonuclease family)